MLTILDVIILALVVLAGSFGSQLLLKYIEYKLTVKKGQEIADRVVALIYRRVMATISEIRAAKRGGSDNV